MFLSQTAKIWHDLPDRMNAKHARTIESNLKKIIIPRKFYIFQLLTCNEFVWYLWYSVFAFKSSISTFGNPEINSSNSCSLKIEIRRIGIIS